MVACGDMDLFPYLCIGVLDIVRMIHCLSHADQTLVEYEYPAEVLMRLQVESFPGAAKQWKILLSATSLL
jgi:hypothetical protein